MQVIGVASGISQQDLSQTVAMPQAVRVLAFVEEPVGDGRGSENRNQNG